MKYMMTIAATDNSSGAGINQDIKVAEKLKTWILTAITGITIQDFNGLETIYPVSSLQLEHQLKKNMQSFDFSVVKIGAICSIENIEVVSRFLSNNNKKFFVITDPIFAPTTGTNFVEEKFYDVYINSIIKKSDLITPNKHELELITKKRFCDLNSAIESGISFSKEFEVSILLTGGHFDADILKDILIEGSNITYFSKQRLNFNYNHGTGCAFSTSLGCYLVRGENLKLACNNATHFVSEYFQDINNRIG